MVLGIWNKIFHQCFRWQQNTIRVIKPTLIEFFFLFQLSFAVLGNAHSMGWFLQLGVWVCVRVGLVSMRRNINLERGNGEYSANWGSVPNYLPHCHRTSSSLSGHAKVPTKQSLIKPFSSSQLNHASNCNQCSKINSKQENFWFFCFCRLFDVDG